MQEMIDFCTQEMRSTGSVLAQMAYRNTLAKAIELRDTVEKEQKKSDFSDGIKFMTIDRIPTEEITSEWYNKKYGNDETQL